MIRLKPRPYQIEARESIYRFFETHPDPNENPVVALPTGTGKSIVIADFVQSVLESWPTQRIMMLTHVKELIEQNADKMLTLWPNAPLGIYSAGLGEKVPYMPITFAGIQSAAKNAELFEHQDLVLIDECHLVSPDENASYRKFLDALRVRNPKLRVIGFSASPYRLGLGMITDGGVFTHICYDLTSMDAFNRLLDEGYLSPLIPIQTKMQMDVTGVHKRGGEFIATELQASVAREEVTAAALEEALQAAAHRSHWLIFAAGIEHVEMTVRLLQQHGITAVAVHSKMSSLTRDVNIDAFKDGKVRALVNADVLTTGFDFPALDCIILLRPTSSPVLHVQILGRGTRPVYVQGFDLDTVEGRRAAIAAGPKQNCLVLDFAGNTMRLGPINDPRIPKKKKGDREGDIPVKVCNACGCLNHISARVCDACGEAFTFKEKLTDEASQLELIARSEPIVEKFPVTHVTYALHKRPSTPQSLKVSYHSGLRRFSEWVCLEHHGNPIQRKARAWWSNRTETEPPLSIEDALLQVESLRVPTQINVWINRQHPEIMSYEF
jgi:DNA repair protein RadD